MSWNLNLQVRAVGVNQPDILHTDTLLISAEAWIGVIQQNPGCQ